MAVGDINQEALVIVIDADRRVLDLEVPADELQTRLAAWKAPEPRYRSGVLARYARPVSSASAGAVTSA